MDGFAIGALGALMFTAAAQMTRLAPQFATGMVARARPMDGLIVEAGIRGVAVPLTAAAVGGLIGTALWFTRPANKKHQHRNYVRIALAVFALAVMAMYAVLGLVDVARFPQILQLVTASHGGGRWRCWRCGSACTLRYCTRRTTRSCPTNRCCVRTAERRARHGLLPGLRRGHAGIVTIVAAGATGHPTRADRRRTG